jgi:release factor glutamine methyltransferase
VNPAPRLPTVGAALDWAQRRLRRTESGPLIAQVLLGRLVKQPRARVLAYPEAALPPDIASAYAALVLRAGGGEPLAYLTGVQEFFGLEFEVTPDVLIPRPETELLTETALDWLAERAADARPPRSVRAVDLGTGSGCIAVTLAVADQNARVTATDISYRALAVAARNARRHGVADRVRLVQADLLAPIRGPLDLLCANLPYALSPSLEGNPSVRFEPRAALDGGPDGLRLVARAIEQSAGRMAAGGLGLFEIDMQHADTARKTAKQAFPNATIRVKKDLAGLERLLVIRT